MAIDTNDGTPVKVSIDDVYKSDSEEKTDMVSAKIVSAPALPKYLIAGIIIGIVAKRYL